MAMLGRWPAWCQLSCWRSIGRNGLMSGSKATGIRRSVVEEGHAAWCRRIRNRSHGGMRWSISAPSTEAQSTPLPARCDHLVIVAGVNAPRPSQPVAWPLIGGSMSATAPPFDAADPASAAALLGTFHLRT